MNKSAEEMVQDLKDSEEIKDFEDVKNMYVLAHRMGSEYTYDTKTKELRARGLALLNRFNEWLMDMVEFGLEKEESLKPRPEPSEPETEPNPPA